MCASAKSSSRPVAVVGDAGVVHGRQQRRPVPPEVALVERDLVAAFAGFRRRPAEVVVVEAAVRQRGGRRGRVRRRSRTKVERPVQVAAAAGGPEHRHAGVHRVGQVVVVPAVRRPAHRQAVRQLVVPALLEHVGPLRDGLELDVRRRRGDRRGRHRVHHGGDVIAPAARDGHRSRGRSGHRSGRRDQERPPANPAFHAVPPFGMAARPAPARPVAGAAGCRSLVAGAGSGTTAAAAAMAANSQASRAS